MAYRPVTPKIRNCAQCKEEFTAKDRRRIYCSSSCNTLAWMARQEVEPNSQPLAKGNLSFSLQNVGVAAAGSGVMAAANYFLNDAPFYKALQAKLDKIEHNQGYQAGQTKAYYTQLQRLQAALRYALPDVDQHLRLHSVDDYLKLDSPSK